MGAPVHDLAVIVVSIPGEPHWLDPCLRSVEAAAAGVDAQIVVVDNDERGDAAALVHERFPGVAVVRCPNRGFAHGNNRGLERADARHVLFLNPDTEVRSGTFASLVAIVDREPRLGVLGVRQVLPDGTVYPTVRRFPNLVRAVLPERLPWAGARLGERELRMERYERRFSCDWVIGSFMLVRGEALREVGPFDERFFLYSEETDLCLRVRRAGYDVVHVPDMTIVHHLHAGKRLAPRMEAQQAWARLQYADKHFGRLHRAAYAGVLRARYSARAALSRGAAADGARLVLDTLRGRTEPPFAALQR